MCLPYLSVQEHSYIHRLFFLFSHIYNVPIYFFRSILSLPPSPPLSLSLSLSSATFTVTLQSSTVIPLSFSLTLAHSLVVSLHPGSPTLDFSVVDSISPSQSALTTVLRQSSRSPPPLSPGGISGKWHNQISPLISPARIKMHVNNKCNFFQKYPKTILRRKQNPKPKSSSTSEPPSPANSIKWRHLPEFPMKLMFICIYIIIMFIFSFMLSGTFSSMNSHNK